jgi:hypothetical protein
LRTLVDSTKRMEELFAETLKLAHMKRRVKTFNCFQKTKKSTKMSHSCTMDKLLNTLLIFWRKEPTVPPLSIINNDFIKVTSLIKLG